ncbi:MAG TPA: acyl-CoA reductase [Pseudonocardiaceae bacterium]|nr:acyl-CoA reductase [Pseudonocardiaceae bacterium]
MDLPAWLARRDRLTVGDERIVDFLSAFARRLLKPDVTRVRPELAALGFFLRPVELHRAVGRARGSTVDGLRVPRGLVLHIPPANVDTLFVYSWALSALAGNRNVVRVSPRSAGAADLVLAALNDTLAAAHPVVGATQLMITYDRDDELTSVLSAACDLRVVWGGDRAVTALRRHPLAPHARDVTFPDRSSFAVISVAGWHAATPARRRSAVVGFHNDAYWFDQAACASPRAVFWIGADSADAQAEFAGLLADVAADRGTTVEPAMAIRKRVSAYGLAADGLVDGVRFAGNAVAVLDLAQPADVPRRWLGTGTFPQATLGSLAELVELVERRDQTLSCFGFERAELVSLATALAGRGVDRIVPFGSALSFAPVWDGYDLLAEFTRLTTVSSTW